MESLSSLASAKYKRFNYNDSPLPYKLSNSSAIPIHKMPEYTKWLKIFFVAELLTKLMEYTETQDAVYIDI